MNPSVLAIAFEAYADAAETILRVALHELPPPGEPANPQWVTIKNPVKTIQINAELMIRITDKMPASHVPQFIISLRPNLVNLVHILNQVSPLLPLCKLRTIFPVQKHLKMVTDLIKRAYLFPEASQKIKTLIKQPKFSLVVRSPIPELYGPAERLFNSFRELRIEAGKKLFTEMRKMDDVIEEQIKNLDKDAKWAPIPEHYFEFRAPSVTLPLVLVDALFPEVYNFKVDPLPFCSTVTESSPLATDPVPGCTVEVMETEDDQPIVIINGVQKKLGQANFGIFPKITCSQDEPLSQASAPLFDISSQSSNSPSPSPPAKKCKTPTTQSQIANIFSQTLPKSLDPVEFSQEIKIEPFEG